MAVERIDFGTQSDPGRYGPETGPRHINAYVEQTIEGQPNFPIYSTPGTDTFATISGGGACRGMIELDEGDMIVLSGNKLVNVDTGGGVTDIGTITGTDFATMARNAAPVPQVSIVMGGLPFVASGGSLSSISDPDLPSPNSTFFLDQRTLYTIPDGRCFYSEIDDATDIDSLSFFTAESDPDGLVRGVAHRNDAWLFGRNTTELWRSTSNADAPFARSSGGIIPKGCSAPFSISTLGTQIFWIGDDDIPYEGSSLTALVHGPVCRAIRDTSNKELITGHAYYEGGYGFWEISGPDFTWVYNVTTGKWFEKRSYGMLRSRDQFGIRFNGGTIVGDQSANVLRRMNAETFTDGGDHLVMTLRTPAMHSYPNRISVHRLYADLVTGVGHTSLTESVFPEEIAFVASATSASDTITAPSSINRGDILVLFDRAVDGGVVTKVVPTGFTQVGSDIGGGSRLQINSYRIADGTESGSTITGTNGDVGDAKVLLQFRPSIPATSVTLSSPGSEATHDDPAAQNIAVSGVSGPVIALAAYASDFVVDPRAFSPSEDGEVTSTAGTFTKLYVKYKLSSSADITVDMDDEGSSNFLSSFYMLPSSTIEIDPQVMLKYSDDGGRSWHGPLSRSLGLGGAYETRVAWNALGTTGRQGRIWELQISSPVIRGVRYAAIEGDLVGT